MYSSIKVFLVEDEFVIREGIKKFIDWGAYGLELCGDAADGELALKQIREKKPEIVITDIRMPFMDGLELSRHIKEELPDTEIIVLSGHEEFTYAQECIKIGVSEYLLKPISREELTEKVTEIAEKIRSRRQELDRIKDADVSPEQFDREKLARLLRHGDREELLENLDVFIGENASSAMESRMFRQYVAMDIYFVTMAFLEEIGIEKERQDELSLQPELLDTREGTVTYLRNLLETACELRGGVRSSRHGEVVDRVVRYIEEHYADEELSLNTVAEAVGFSPNHLSTVFHQAYGKSFVKYLTDYRMGIAKKLLLDGVRPSEVCYQVGYKDPHYFSSTFKKTQGMTPTQYRSGN